jgi:hypothetical protein
LNHIVIGLKDFDNPHIFLEPVYILSVNTNGYVFMVLEVLADLCIREQITYPFSISLIDSAIVFPSVLESIGEPLYKLRIIAFIYQFGSFLNGCPFSQSITNRKKMLIILAGSSLCFM